MGKVPEAPVADSGGFVPCAQPGPLLKRTLTSSPTASAETNSESTPYVWGAAESTPVPLQNLPTPSSSDPISLTKDNFGVFDDPSSTLLLPFEGNGSAWTESLLHCSQDFQIDSMPSWILQCLNPTEDLQEESQSVASSSLQSAQSDGVDGSTLESPLSDSILIPNIAFFFERMHPIMPVFSRSWLFERLDREHHKTSRDFSAMLLAMSALAIVQPVKSSERTQRSEHFRRARALLEQSAVNAASSLM